jgi:3-phenylpropionate/trans-cinnamate dioxygenase ferredoxin reductase subunit
MTTDKTEAGIVIVGAGECGGRAALALRDKGYTGRVTLVGSESELPYERPPLSKPAGDSLDDALNPVCVAMQERFAEADSELRLGCEVSAIDRDARCLQLADGDRLPYAQLLLATGARPRRLPLPGDEHLLALRTLADARQIYTAAASAQRAVIVGAGLIGLEMAALLRKHGVAVSVVEAAPRALGRAVPVPLAQRLTQRHLDAGVEFHFDARIESIDANGLKLAGGERIDGDLLIGAVGAQPNVELAEAAGLVVDNGIRVDAQLRTDDPLIFAAGDCSNAYHPRYDRAMRLETWRNACDQADCAADNLLGMGREFAQIPWFWTDQYELGLQVAGLFESDQQLVSRPIGEDAELVFALDGAGRLVAAGGLGPGNSVAKDIKIAEKLIERAAVIAAETLSDPASNLKKLLKSA